MNRGVENGLFHVSGSHWHTAADVQGDENREVPCEARHADAPLTAVAVLRAGSLLLLAKLLFSGVLTNGRRPSETFISLQIIIRA